MNSFGVGLPVDYIEGGSTRAGAVVVRSSVGRKPKNTDRKYNLSAIIVHAPRRIRRTQFIDQPGVDEEFITVGQLVTRHRGGERLGGRGEGDRQRGGER